MRTNKKILVAVLLILLASFSCEKEEVLPANQAKGTIIAKFGNCYGAWMMIEVENPKGIGKAGEFSYNGQKLTYRNAIGVPYFEFVPWLKKYAPGTEGTWLYFEYREATIGDNELFGDTTYTYPKICHPYVNAPAVSYYIITRIIEYH